MTIFMIISYDKVMNTNFWS